MANSKKTELATVGSFELTVNRFEGLSPEDLEELKDQMEDLDQDTGIACRLIKIPSGGKLAYEVQTGEDETDVDYMKEVEGVIIFTHRLNGYWPGAFGTDDNKVPACSSMDGKTAVWTDTGEVRTCENCPLNQYGSDDNPNGTGKGKACKNMRRIYLMMNGDPNFYLLTVPPTSIKDVNKQLTKIITGGTPYTGLIVSFKLEKAKNAKGVEYSKVTVEKKGLLPPAVSAVAKEMRRQIKAKYQDMTITLAEYAPAQDQGAATAPPPEAAAGQAAPDAGEFAEAGELPFSGD